MKVLVSGGSGFIGGHVVDELLMRGIRPVIFNHKRHQDSQVEFFLGDVRDYTSVAEAVALVDGVIHLAGVLGTAETISKPEPAVETNIKGSLNVFEACRHYERKCVYITVGNYWMQNSYSITKTTAERFAWMFNRELGTKIAVVRAVNAYGPGQKAAPVRKIIPNFILPALRDEAITVYGDGSQVMDMIYVEDLATILVDALVREHEQYVYAPQRQDAPPRFDAGPGLPTTVREIAEMVIRLVGSGRIEYAPMRQGEPPGSVVLADPTTLETLYGKEHPFSFVPLDIGLQPTIEYYRPLA